VVTQISDTENLANCIVCVDNLFSLFHNKFWGTIDSVPHNPFYTIMM